MLIQIPQSQIRPGTDVPYEARDFLNLYIWEDIIRLKHVCVMTMYILMTIVDISGFYH